MCERDSKRGLKEIGTDPKFALSKAVGTLSQRSVDMMRVVADKHVKTHFIIDDVSHFLR